MNHQGTQLDDADKQVVFRAAEAMGVPREMIPPEVLDMSGVRYVARLGSATDALAVKMATVEHLDVFLRMSRSCRSDDEWVQLSRRLFGEKVIPSEWEASANIKYERDTLAAAPLFFWRQQTAEMVTVAAQSYPLRVPLCLPSLQSAVFVFEHPHDIGYGHLNIQALGWLPYRGEEGDWLKVWAVSVDGIPYLTLTISPTDCAEGIIEPDRRSLLQWICAATMFLEQRLCEGVSTEHAYRQMRKQAERKGIDSSVQTVYLRRVGRRQSSDGDATVEYSCRWLVSGHWREQWYPKMQRHVPRWIAPYPKGPEGKPFKAPRERVFAVVR